MHVVDLELGSETGCLASVEAEWLNLSCRPGLWEHNKLQWRNVHVLYSSKSDV